MPPFPSFPPPSGNQPRAASPSVILAPRPSFLRPVRHSCAPSVVPAPRPSLLRPSRHSCAPPSFLRTQESTPSTVLKISPILQTFPKVSSRARPLIPSFLRPSVIPAQAGIQANRRRSFAFRTPNGPQTPLREAVGAPRTTRSHEIAWIPACAGMTEGDTGMTETGAASAVDFCKGLQDGGRFRGGFAGTPPIRHSCAGRNEGK